MLPKSCGCQQCSDGCPRGCNKAYKPICGSDGETYDNQCILDNHNCVAKKMMLPQVKVIHTGKCKVVDPNAPTPLAACAAGYTKVGGCCFHLGKSRLNWLSAGKYCKSKGGRLMDVDPISWHGVLVKYLSSAKSPFKGVRLYKSAKPTNFNIWLGGNDIRRERSFRWSCSNKSVKRGAPWYPREPDNKDIRRRNADCMSWVYYKCIDRKCRRTPRTLWYWADELCREGKFPLCIHNDCKCGTGPTK